MAENWLSLPDFFPANIVMGFGLRGGEASIVKAFDPFRVNQVHGANVVQVSKQMSRDACAQCAADALVTNESSLAIAVKTADCLPVLISDREGMVIAAAHAGWRGLAAGVLTQVVTRMHSTYGCEFETLRVALGPHLSACCFEVGSDVYEAFAGRGKTRAAALIRKSSDKWHANQALLAQDELIESGVKPDFIHQVRGCTGCECERFYSYRREKSGAGRLLNFIVKDFAGRSSF